MSWLLSQPLALDFKPPLPTNKQRSEPTQERNILEPDRRNKLPKAVLVSSDSGLDSKKDFYWEPLCLKLMMSEKPMSLREVEIHIERQSEWKSASNLKD